MFRTRQFFALLTWKIWKCASRHNGVHFLDISTSKSIRTLVCFVHFDLEMCFAPQQRRWCGLYISTSKGASRHNGMTFSTQRPKVLRRWCGNTFWFPNVLPNVLRATTACTFSTSQRPKVVRRWCALYILTWKCASRRQGVRFFDITTSKRAPMLVWFVHLGFQMCFAPQRRALFRHLNVQKCSEACVVCTFWLPNVLRATTACNFSTSQRPKSALTLVWFAHFDFQMCFAPQRRALFRHLNVQKWSDACVVCTFWLPNVLRTATACTFSTSQRPKDPPTLVWFAHFDFQMCFAPQRRAIFWHLNVQKCSDACVVCTFWLPNVLRATTACTFSTSQRPKVLRRWCGRLW